MSRKRLNSAASSPALLLYSRHPMGVEVAILETGTRWGWWRRLETTRSNTQDVSSEERLTIPFFRNITGRSAQKKWLVVFAKQVGKSWDLAVSKFIEYFFRKTYVLMIVLLLLQSLYRKDGKIWIWLLFKYKAMVSLNNITKFTTLSISNPWNESVAYPDYCYNNSHAEMSVIPSKSFVPFDPTFP